MHCVLPTIKSYHGEQCNVRKKRVFVLNQCYCFVFNNIGYLNMNEYKMITQLFLVYPVQKITSKLENRGKILCQHKIALNKIKIYYNVFVQPNPKLFTI